MDEARTYLDQYDEMIKDSKDMMRKTGESLKEMIPDMSGWGSAGVKQASSSLSRLKDQVKDIMPEKVAYNHRSLAFK